MRPKLTLSIIALAFFGEDGRILSSKGRKVCVLFQQYRCWDSYSNSSLQFFKLIFHNNVCGIDILVNNFFNPILGLIPRCSASGSIIAVRVQGLWQNHITIHQLLFCVIPDLIPVFTGTDPDCWNSLENGFPPEPALDSDRGQEWQCVSRRVNSYGF